MSSLSPALPPLFALLESVQASEWEVWKDTLLLKNHLSRYAIISTAALGFASGLVGSFLLLRKRSLMGDALAHSTFPGIVLAFTLMVLFGGEGKSLPALLLGASLFGVLGVLTMLLIRRTTKLRDDVAMGLVLSVFFGLGMVLKAFATELPAESSGLEGFIKGQVATISLFDFGLIMSMLGVVFLLSLLLFKEFKLLCFDERYAASQGWPTLWLDILLLAMVTTVTVVGLQSVGLILIIAFLVIPPAAARFWTQNLERMTLISALLGAASGWIGASLSAALKVSWGELPAGALIVLVASSLFILSLLFAPQRGVLARAAKQRALQNKVQSQHLLRAVFELLEKRAQDQEFVPNAPFSRDELLAKRTWNDHHLSRIIARERRARHLTDLGDGQLRLSEEGFGEATRITRNHRLWELYLVTHADIAPSHVDRDADMVEHILEAELVAQLEEELRDRGTWIASPHGIPAAAGQVLGR